MEEANRAFSLLDQVAVHQQKAGFVAADHRAFIKGSQERVNPKRDQVPKGGSITCCESGSLTLYQSAIILDNLPSPMAACAHLKKLLLFRHCRA